MDLMTRCERCGKLVETEGFSMGVWADFRAVPAVAIGTLDLEDCFHETQTAAMALCPDCAEKLKAWLAGKPEAPEEPQAAADSVERLVVDMARAFTCPAEDCCNAKIACEYFGHGNLIGCRDRELSRHGNECPAAVSLSNGCWETMRADIRRRCAELGIDLEEDEDDKR